MPVASGGPDDAAALPRVPAGMIQRPRLLALLDDEWDAIVVTGPAGAGKSTLLAQWAATSTAPVRWLEAGDGFRSADALAPNAGDHRTTVIDRAERLSDDAVRDLATMLETTPTERLVLITRSPDTATRLASMTDQTVARIGPDQLLVDDAELAALLPGRDESAVREIASESGGLIIGVRDALESRSGLLADRFRGRLIADLDERPEGYGGSVAHLTLVESVDADLAARIGVPESHLRLALSDGLLTAQDGWYDMTAFAVRAFEPLAARLAPVERERIRRLALETASLRRERPYAALRLAAGLRDFDEATRVVMDHGLAITDEPDQARRALAGVGYRDVKRHPILIAVLAQLAYLRRSTRVHGLMLYGRAVAEIRAGISKASPIQTAWFRVFTAALMRISPMADRALAKTRRAVADLDQLDAEGQTLSVIGGQLMTHAGITGFFGGDDDFAGMMYERAYGTLVDLDSPERVDPLSLHAAMAAYRGDLPLARDLAETAEASPWPAGWRTGLRGQALALALAVLALEADDEAAASAQLSMTGPIEDLVEHWVTFGVVRAWRDLLAGEQAQGIARIRELRAHRARSPITSVSRARLDAAEAMLLMTLGDPTAALPLAAAAARHTPEGGLELARVQLALGRVGEAGAALARVAELAPAPRVALGADLLAATIALRGHDTAAGDVRLLQAADGYATTGLRLPFLPLTDEDRDLLGDGAQRLGKHELAAALTTARGARPAVDLRVPQLTPREQAVLDALADGESNSGIAARLFVSPNTVKSQLRALYRKLDADSREQAIARAAALGLIGGAPGDTDHIELEDRLA